MPLLASGQCLALACVRRVTRILTAPFTRHSGDSTAEVKEAQLRYMERRYLRLAHTLREVVHAMKFHHKGGIVSAVISALIELQKEAEAAGVYSTQ